MITYEYGEGYLPEIWYQCDIPKKKLSSVENVRTA